VQKVSEWRSKRLNTCVSEPDAHRMRTEEEEVGSRPTHLIEDIMNVEPVINKLIQVLDFLAQEKPDPNQRSDRTGSF